MAIRVPGVVGSILMVDNAWVCWKMLSTSKAGYALFIFSRCFMKNNVKCVNIPLHTFYHFHTIFLLCKKPLMFQLAIHLSRNIVNWLQNMKNQKVCRVCLVHFLEHNFRISYFTSFRSNWRFLIPKVSCRESKVHENGEKRVKECLHISHSFSWNTLKCCVKLEIVAGWIFQ